MRSEARIYTRRNDDPDWTALPIGPQWAFDLVLSQEDLEHHGVIALRPARWARQAHGVTEQELTGHLQVLHERRFIVIDDKYGELLVRSLLREDKVYKQPNVLRSAAVRLTQIKSPAIRQALHTELLRIGDLHDLSEPCRLIVKQMQEATAPGAPVSSRPPRRLRSTPIRSATGADNRTAKGSPNPSRTAAPDSADNGAAGPSAKADAYRQPNSDASPSDNPPAAPAAPGGSTEASADQSRIPSRNGAASQLADVTAQRQHEDGTDPARLTAMIDNTSDATVAPTQRKPLGGWDFNQLEATTVALSKPWLATLAVAPDDQLLEDVEYQISEALIAGYRANRIAAALSAWQASGSTDPRKLHDLIEAPAAHDGPTRDATTPPSSAEQWLAVAKADQ